MIHKVGNHTIKFILFFLIWFIIIPIITSICLPNKFHFVPIRRKNDLFYCRSILNIGFSRYRDIPIILIYYIRGINHFIYINIKYVIQRYLWIVYINIITIMINKYRNKNRNIKSKILIFY